MKILIAGDWHSELHEQPLYEALINTGNDVYKFSWHQYFKINSAHSNPEISQKVNEKNFIKNISYRFQNKYMIGPINNNLNNDLVNKVSDLNPDVVFIYRGSHIFKDTLIRIKKIKPTIIIVGYNNDDPFSPYYPKWKWRHFKSSVNLYDLILSYRKINISEYYAHGAKQVKLFRSWFDKSRHFHTKLNDHEKRKYECDIVFIGHYENDGRIQYLEEIVKRGWDLKIFGPREWNKELAKSKYLKKYYPISLIWGKEYNLALNGAKIALCFFSKPNRDTYTRRVFEIPATKTVLLSEYTDEMISLFEPNKEAMYFKSIDEMVLNVNSILNNEDRRKQIEKLGERKVYDGGHEINDRAIKLVEYIKSLKNN